MKRSEFLYKTAACSAFIALPGKTFANVTSDQKPVHLTILHTNDVHSHIDPFPANDPRNANIGGVARRASLIETVRKENPNLLLLDAGDIFQGTPYFNYYGGALEMKLMTMLGYDLGTLGNHDFDNGIEGFHKQLPLAKFDFVSANYDFRNTILDGIVKPYKVFERNGIKIGIFGLGVALEGLVDQKNYRETVYLDPVEISTDMARILKHEKKCDLVIALSHIGYAYQNEPDKICDLNLAAKTRDIDLIIGGHTHTFLNKPTLVKNRDGQDVIVNQVGCYGINLGRIDFYFEKGKTQSSVAKTIVV